MRNRCQEDIEEDIRRLEEWLLKQSHLPHVVEKDILSSFVVGTKSLEIAKRKLEGYFTWRLRLPNVFSFSARDSSDPYFRQCSKAGQLFFLPKTTPEGYRVIFMRCMFTDSLVKFFNHDRTTAAFFMSLELGMHLWPDMEAVYIIVDMKHFSPNHVTMFNLNTTQSATRCFMECIPLRFVGATAFNAGSFLNIFFNNIMKPFIREKFSRRIIITMEDESSLRDNIPSEILPSNYGGNEKSSSELYSDWLKLVEENRDWFKITSNLVADESKRLADRTHTFGIEGTFRKLNID